MYVYVYAFMYVCVTRKYACTYLYVYGIRMQRYICTYYYNVMYVCNAI